MTRPAPLAPGLIAAAVLARQSALGMERGDATGPAIGGAIALRAHGEDCVRIATREVYDDAGDDDACAREALRERLWHAAAVARSQRTGITRAAWATVLALLLGSVLAVVTARAAAQSDALMLARTCVSERGWRTETTDCRAIGEVVRSRMERHSETWRQAMRALSPRLHGGTVATRLWRLELDESDARPRHLGRARWEGMRLDAWRATLAEARAIIAGEVASPCASRPMAWGSPEDLRRRERLSGRRWVPVDCGESVNRFGGWRWPREVDPE